MRPRRTALVLVLMAFTSTGAAACRNGESPSYGFGSDQPLPTPPSGSGGVGYVILRGSGPGPDRGLGGTVVAKVRGSDEQLTASGKIDPDTGFLLALQPGDYVLTFADLVVPDTGPVDADCPSVPLRVEKDRYTVLSVTCV
jgi:hypothetical protein